MRYRIKAIAAGGAVQVVSVDAGTPAQAEQIARERGLSVISTHRETAGFGSGGGSMRFPLQVFAQQLVSLLDAGLSTVEALEALAQENQGHTARQLQAVLAQVHSGRSLSYALEQSPAAFPPLFVATVRASERTGDLQEALTRFVDYQRQIEQLRKKVVSASIYPLLLAGTGLLVTAFLLFYVVPRFSQIYEDIGGDLPFLSKLLMQWGQLLAAHAVTVVAGVVLVIGTVVFGLSRPALRGELWRRMWSIPRVGEVLRVYQLARFYRTLGMLQRGGMPLPWALDMAEGLLDPVLRPSLASARRAVREGQPASDALSNAGLTTPMSVSMLRVGERTGELGAMMDRIAAYYDEDLARWVEFATRLFEPLLMAAIGVLIGAIVVLLYLPVFELAGSLK